MSLVLSDGKNKYRIRVPEDKDTHDSKEEYRTYSDSNNGIWRKYPKNEFERILYTKDINGIIRNEVGIELNKNEDGNYVDAFGSIIT